MAFEQVGDKGLRFKSHFHERVQQAIASLIKRCDVIFKRSSGDQVILYSPIMQCFSIGEPLLGYGTYFWVAR